MIRHQLIEDKGVEIISPEGRLSSDDFKSLAAEVDPYIQRKGSLNGLLLEAEKFPGWKDWKGFEAHVHFVRTHHREIKRIAVVSDSKVLTLAPHIAEHMVKAKVRHFPTSERDAALLWVGDGDLPTA